MPRTAYLPRLMLSISVLTLAACGGGDATPKTPAPMPPVAGEATDAPQPLAASDTLTPILPPAAPNETTTVTTTTQEVVTDAPIVSVPVGAMPIGTAAGVSIEDRIARLEQTVGSLRADYDRIMPAFASLNTTNERIQSLLDEIERDTGKRPAAAALAPVANAAPAGVASETTIVTTTTTAPPVAAPPIAMQAPAPVKTVTTQTIKTEPAAAEPTAETPAAAGMVNNVRIGEHGNKTRIVLDMSGRTKPDFKYDLDNAEKLLLVDMPSMGWAGASTGKGGAAAPLVSGWDVQKGASGGLTMAIQLKKDARVLSTQFLPPEGKDPARLVMDIAAGG